jgi:hypothetical protein
VTSGVVSHKGGTSVGGGPPGGVAIASLLGVARLQEMPVPCISKVGGLEMGQKRLFALWRNEFVLWA